MTITSIFTIGLVAALPLLNTVKAQQFAPLKAKKQFVIAANITQNDYLPKTIVLKLKPQFRNLGSNNKIEHAQLQQVLSYLGTNSLTKKYPRHEAPKEKHNYLHQAYADLSLIYELKYSTNVKLEDAINQVLASGIMQYAEPHYIHQLHNVTPNDPLLSANQNGFLSRIRAYAAWDLALGGSQGNSSIVIGIVDSGTDIDHVDLASQFVINTADPINGADDDNDGYIDNNKGYDLAGADYNNVVGDNNPNIMGNNNNHGSHVSGCAAAATNNGVGVAGIGWNCKLLPVKCAADNDTRGSGGVGYVITGYDGITYAADHGAKIINCSWGGTGGGQFGQDIIDYATINKNCLVVASAGNSNLDERLYPSSFNYVLSVGATNSTTDARASFSTYNYDVDISTPGKAIYETIYNTANNTSYASLDGTSMSSPITAGGAGLVQAKYNYTNALQIGQRLKQTADNHYIAGPNVILPNTGANVQNKLGKGRMNLQRALTDADAPSVIFANSVLVDHNDNAIIVGDSLFITGDFVNYLAPTTNLTASITAIVGGTYVTAIDNNTTLGVINTLTTKNNNTDPFSFKINAGTPDNSLIRFKVTLTDGTYTDSYFIEVIVNVDYVNIAINDVATTITSKGKIGYNLDGQLQGLGFTYLGTNLLYEGALMVGSSATKVSDAFRGSYAGGADVDFQTVVKAYKAASPVFSEFDVHGQINDLPVAATAQKLLISHNAYAWTTTGNRKYVIVDYTIKNNGSTTLSNLYAGIAADWDIDAATAGANKGNYDAATKMGYVYSTAINGLYAGIKVLTTTAPAVCYHIDNMAGGGGGVDVVDSTVAGNKFYSTSKKYTTLSTNRYLAGVSGTVTTGADIIEVVSSGPFTIVAGDSVKVAFALIAGDNLADIVKSADSAQVHYNVTPVPTALKQNTLIGGNVTVYPNPTNDNLNFIINLNTASKAEIDLTNTLGQTVKHITKDNLVVGNNYINTSVADLPVGTYFYRVNCNGKITSGKIMISK